MSKTIVVTGGSRGIGAAAAVLAGKRGWSVAFNYRGNDEAAKMTADAIIAAGGKALAVKGNVANEADVIDLFDRAIEAFGPIDGVVNNAGIIGQGMAFADKPTDQIRTIVDINVFGAILVEREAARRMSKSRGGNGGSIVNVSSAAVKLGGAGESVDYAASKAAVEPMTIGLSKELGPEGIRVNTVRPGLIATDIHDDVGSPDRLERLVATTPIGRAGTAAEVGEGIVWLLSDDSSYVSGTILEVTGGR